MSGSSAGNQSMKCRFYATGRVIISRCFFIQSCSIDHGRSHRVTVFVLKFQSKVYAYGSEYFRLVEYILPSFLFLFPFFFANTFVTKFCPKNEVSSPRIFIKMHISENSYIRASVAFIT